MGSFVSNPHFGKMAIVWVGGDRDFFNGYLCGVGAMWGPGAAVYVRSCENRDGNWRACQLRLAWLTPKNDFGSALGNITRGFVYGSPI